MAGFKGRARRHLSLRGRTWWFKMAVPEAVRHHFRGKTAIVESLDTGDIRTAMDRRDGSERAALDLFKAIRTGAVITPTEERAEWRGTLTRETIKALQAAGDKDALYDAVSAAEDEAEGYRGRDRKRFDAAVAGRLPVDHYLDAYLKEAALAEKTTNEWRGLVKRFARWCAESDLRLPDIDRRAAGRYVSDEIAGMNIKTAKKHLSAVRGYWGYLARRGLVETELTGNPWDNQLQPQKGKKGKADNGNTERPFTTEELNAVLYGGGDTVEGPFDGQLRDAGLIAALSGMRLAEIVTLRVEQTTGGWFDIKDAKTQAGIRRVPIHSGLRKLIEARTKGKGPKDWLFHELAGESWDAAAVMTKRFTRYRVACGVDDKVEGKRRSLVNFHSFRRWFITEARHAGQPVEVVQDVVGHAPDKKDITFGVYTQGASEKQLRACVEAVRLPRSDNKARCPWLSNAMFFMRPAADNIGRW